MSSVRMYAHAAQSLLREWSLKGVSGLGGGSAVERRQPSALRDALREFDADTVVVYAGLSDVAAAFGGDPYERLRDALFAEFDAVLTPGFTFSFRRTGTVDLDRAPPETGTFGRRFLADAAFRTDDPVFSLLGAGDFAFATDGTDRSYGPDGYWAELHDQDVVYLNVGTGRFRCSAFHLAEVRHRVPYVSETELSGLVKRNGDVRRVTHRIPTDDRYRRFARRKVRADLGDALTDASVGGVRIQGCRASDVDALLDDRLSEDEYYLVSR